MCVLLIASTVMISGMLITSGVHAGGGGGGGGEGSACYIM